MRVRGDGPPAKALSARAVLVLERPLQAGGGVYVGAGDVPPVALDPPGKIRRENVVLRSGEDWGAVLTAGNGGLFVVDMDVPG